MTDDLLIPFMTFMAVTAVGGAFLANRMARRQRLRERLDSGFGQAENCARPSPLLRLLTRLGMVAAPGGASAGLKAELAWAGYQGERVMAIYLGTKLLLLCIGLAGLIMLVLPLERLPFGARIGCIVGGSGLLFFLPNLVVRSRRRRRRQEVRSSLPHALDLLEICVSSGMGIDLAWNSVTSEVRNVSPVLADEMALTDFEIHLNAPRATAMRHMAERTGAEEMSSLVTVLVQSERFGTSIGEALRAFSTAMCEARSTRAQEAAEKMVVKLLFPMILLIFPAMLIVICGPAGLRWAEVLANG